MKYQFLYLVLLLIAQNTNAQFAKKEKQLTRYEGAIELTSCLPINEKFTNTFALETVHGFNVEEKCFAGIGAGFRSINYELIIEEYKGPSYFYPVNIHQFEYDITFFLQVDVRLSSIRKLRKHFIPCFSIRWLYLYHPWSEKKYLNDLNPLIPQTNYEIFAPTYVYEFSLGGEFVMKNFPRFYSLITFYPSSFSQGLSYKNDDNPEESFNVGIKAPIGLNLKLGVRF